MSKKTFKVAKLLNMVNNMNQSEYGDASMRMGVNTVLENVLMDTGNYHGFLYLTSRDVPEGAKPGIIFGEDGSDNQYPDESRRCYYGVQ